MLEPVVIHHAVPVLVDFDLAGELRRVETLFEGLTLRLKLFNGVAHIAGIECHETSLDAHPRG